MIGAGEKVFLQVLSRLLHSVLLTSRCAQHTTAAPVLTKFCSHMKIVASLLARLQRALAALTEVSKIIIVLIFVLIGGFTWL